MQYVYFVPGFAGTELYLPVLTGKQIWVDYGELALGGFSTMGLRADGINPAILCGEALIVGGPLPDWYGAPIQLLQQQLGAGYQVLPWGWDFRLKIETAGAALAASIQASSSAATPAVIVAHSAGGLVARIAWSILLAAGQEALVSRIITLGTPHQGSYAAVQLMSLANSTLLGLSALSSIALTTIEALGIPIPPCAIGTPFALLEVVLTWPSIYELLPILGSPDQSMDPNRPALFTATNWRTVGVNQTWLSNASGPWATLMVSAASYPPANVLTTFAGTYISTPDILESPASLGFPSAYGSTVEGDGVVTVEDALVPQSWQYVAPCSHQDLPLFFVANALVAKEVVAARPPPTPVPPVDLVSPGGFLTLGPPPYTPANFPNNRRWGGGQIGDC